MTGNAVIPKEGDIYTVVNIGKHTFELKYGYYEEGDRECGEPVVIYPELSDIYTEEGLKIVTAIQTPCKHYKVQKGCGREECCSDCIYYPNRRAEIGVCKCEKNRRIINSEDTK